MSHDNATFSRPAEREFTVLPRGKRLAPTPSAICSGRWGLSFFGTVGRMDAFAYQGNDQSFILSCSQSLQSYLEACTGSFVSSVGLMRRGAGARWQGAPHSGCGCKLKGPSSCLPSPGKSRDWEWDEVCVTSALLFPSSAGALQALGAGLAGRRWGWQQAVGRTVGTAECPLSKQSGPGRHV